MPISPSRFVAALLVAAALCGPARSHVLLLAPNGGEVLPEGSSFTIQWQVSIAHATQDWDLWYSTTGPAGPWIPIATNLPPGGVTVGSINTYDWTVPNDPSNQVRVRVRMDNTGTDYYDFSDADLTIGQPCLVSSYGTGKVNSLGLTPTITATGTPGVTLNDFQLFAAGAVPNRPGLFFWGLASTSLPFQGGTLHVQPPLKRMPSLFVDAFGFASQPVVVDPTMVGTSRYYQLYYRDPDLGPPFPVGLSDGLAVQFCP